MAKCCNVIREAPGGKLLNEVFAKSKKIAANDLTIKHLSHLNAPTPVATTKRHFPVMSR